MVCKDPRSPCLQTRPRLHIIPQIVLLFHGGCTCTVLGHRIDERSGFLRVEALSRAWTFTLLLFPAAVTTSGLSRQRFLSQSGLLWGGLLLTTAKGRGSIQLCDCCPQRSWCCFLASVTQPTLTETIHSPESPISRLHSLYKSSLQSI